LNPNLDLERHPFVQNITPKLAKIFKVCIKDNSNGFAGVPFRAF